MFLRDAYDDEAAGRDPLPSFLRSRAVVAPGDHAEAVGLLVDAVVRLAWNDPDEILQALCLDAQLEADADAFTGATSQ